LISLWAGAWTWWRSLVDLVNTLQELVSLNVGLFVSPSEAIDLTACWPSSLNSKRRWA